MTVLALGAASLDVKGRPLTSLTPGSSVPGRLRISRGGVARNVAENLARLGVETRLLSAVGEDEFGRELLAHTAEAGVDVSLCLRIPGGRTAAYLALLTEDGYLDLGLDDMGVLEAISPQVIYRHRRWIRDARMLVVDTNLTPRALATLFRLADRYRVPVCLDPVSVSLARRALPHLGQLHLVTPNAREAEVLTDLPVRTVEEAARAAQRLVARGVQIAVITLERMGLFYATAEGETGHIPALPCEVVDNTGAGDALTAAVIFGLLEGFPVDEAVRLGVSAAALTLGHPDTVRPDLSLDLLYQALAF